MSRVKKLLFWLSVIVGIGFISFVIVLRVHYTVPVLMYHSVYPQAPAQNRLSVSAESFERQMRFLRDRAYNVVHLDELAGMIRSGTPIPPKTVAVTFDDGYRNNYQHAFPVIKKYKIPVTMFIIVDEIGRSQEDRLYWDEIKQMYGSGLVRIGSHCMGPEPLINLTDEAEVRRQIRQSKQVLEEQLGGAVTAFSYPEGLFNERIRQLVREAGYTVAVATNPGRQVPDNDVFALKRLRISATSDNLFVFWFESSGYYNFLRERRHK